MKAKILNTYQKYDSYKDSDVDWVGDIPSDWEVVPLRTIFKFRNENNRPVITEDILSLSIANGVTKYSDSNRGGNKRKDDITAYKIARPNDIVLNSMNVVAGAVGVSRYFGAISPVYYALYIHDETSVLEYYSWVFQNQIFQRNLLKYGKGILIKFGEFGKMNTVRMKISQHDMKTLVFPKPSVENQKKIAKFLNRKSGQIDQAINLKQQQIEKLNEYKQITIQNAVTKGLNANAKMKDSGIDWMGDIPKHWEVISLRYLFDFLNKDRVPISADERGGMQGIYPYYGASGIIDYVNDYIFDEKLILIAEDGANLLSKSTPLAFIAEGKYWVNNHAHILKPKYEGFEFWAKLLSLCDYTVYITGAAQPKLSRGNLGNVLLPVPPAEEMLAISKKLEQDLPRYFDAAKRFKAQIERLKEYKTILINQAVTGKIKVS